MGLPELELAANMIQNDDGYYIENGIFFTATNILTNIHTRNRNEPTYLLLIRVNNIFSKILTILQRLDWQRKLKDKGELDYYIYLNYAESDIDYFHVLYRSLFDDVAKVLRNISQEPGQVKCKSFKSLRKWVKVSSNRKRMGEDIASIVDYCDWFEDIRKIRDSVTHREGSTMVFPEEKYILFQTHEKGFRKILIQELMFNKNVVIFEYYAALYLSKLLIFLDKVAKISFDKLQLRQITGNLKYSHVGLGILHEWIDQFKKQYAT